MGDPQIEKCQQLNFDPDLGIIVLTPLAFVATLHPRVTDARRISTNGFAVR